MHLTRSQLTKKIPVPRKGTKYIARARSNIDNAVPVVVAVRDMIALAKTAKEVKEMIKQKLLKINARDVTDLNDSIKLMDILEADHTYQLTYTPNGKFTFEKTSAKERPCKVIGKKAIDKKTYQINLHEGSNIRTSDKIAVSDTVYVDMKRNIVKHIAFEKGKECFVIKGAFTGSHGKVESVEANFATVKLKDHDKTTTLKKSEVIVL